MEGYLKVSPEILRSTASEFASEGTKVSSQTQQMMSIVTGLSSSWEGQASSAYINKFKQLQDDINKIVSMIQEHVSDLEEMADNYADAEKKNTAVAGALPGDVIADFFVGTAKNEKGLSKGKGGESSSNSENTSKRDYSGWGIEEGSIRSVEYAYLSKFASDAAAQKDEDILTNFVNAIHNTLPKDHPLQKIHKYSSYKLGEMEAFVIEIDPDHAIVVFSGTNPDSSSDILTDARIAAGYEGGYQIEAANSLIESLPYKDISVTGHSLGGYIAADVTLNNDKISSCVTFDPLGRAHPPNRNQIDRVSKITNNIVVGSPVNKIGAQVGKVYKRTVKENYDDGPLLKNHNINHIINDAFGGINGIIY